MVDYSVPIMLLALLFLVLLLITFFCFNIRRKRRHADFMVAEAVPVESAAGLDGNLFLFSQPFAMTPGNPQLLHGEGHEVVYEKNGIHYINNSVFIDNENGEELDSHFATLVESVVNI